MYTFKARILLPGGAQQEVTVQADNQVKAKALIEAQYGRGSIIGDTVRQVS